MLELNYQETVESLRLISWFGYLFLIGSVGFLFYTMGMPGKQTGIRRFSWVFFLAAFGIIFVYFVGFYLEARYNHLLSMTFSILFFYGFSVFICFQIYRIRQRATPEALLEARQSLDNLLASMKRRR